MQRDPSIRIAMDIGGTFTDVVAFDETARRYQTAKVPTTPDDLTRGVLAGAQGLVPALSDVAFTVHGTTAGLNAFLERRGVRVMLLATEGVGDVLHVARGNRTALYDIHYRKPEPLVPRRDIREIGGRLDSSGGELTPLDEEAARAAARYARDNGFGAVAVAFLFSYLNPEHELRVAELVAEEAPELSVSLSHRVAREWREYERTSSTVIEAYSAPTIRGYLGRLDEEMRSQGLGVDLHVMQSSGGTLSLAAARERPLQTLLSGPAGGAVGGSELADALDRPNLICVDMGGTSFDVTLIVGGRPDVSSETELEGLPMLLPIVNIHTVGAGGGSIAYLEAGGLRVGPESAGAEPGPACYGRGGERPTVTDANLALGRIDAKSFAGGEMELHPERAEVALATLAMELGIEAPELAEGIVRVIDAKMAQAIRTLTVEQGVSPSDFAIVAFGGAGPTHAASLARELEIDEVIVPPLPGAFSAWGMLQTDARHDVSRAFFRPVHDADPGELAELADEMRTEVDAVLAGDAIPAERRAFETSVDLRYEGQEYTVTVPVDPADPDPLTAATAAFHAAHEGRYGHSNELAPVEAVTLRLTGLGRIDRPGIEAAALSGDADGVVRPVVFDAALHDTTIVARDSLVRGAALEGPAIVLEATSTAVVPPGCALTVDPSGSLVVHVGRDAA